MLCRTQAACMSAWRFVSKPRSSSSPTMGAVYQRHSVRLSLIRSRLKSRTATDLVFGSYKRSLPDTVGASGTKAAKLGVRVAPFSVFRYQFRKRPICHPNRKAEELFPAECLISDKDHAVMNVFQGSLAQLFDSVEQRAFFESRRLVV